MMKKYALFALLLLSIGLTFCKKKSNKGPAASGGPSLDSIYMHATVNGTPWRADTAAGYSVTGSANNYQTGISITATQKSTASQVVLYITNYGGVGTYNIDPPSVTATYYVGNKRYYASSGQIIITNTPQYFVQGTYSFVADSINITGGTFTVIEH